MIVASWGNLNQAIDEAIYNVNDVEIGRSEYVFRRAADRESDRVNRQASTSILAQTARLYVDHPMSPPWYAGVQAIERRR